MVLRLCIKLALLSLLLSVTDSAFSQVEPAGSENHFPISVGAGITDFSLDFGSDNGKNRRMEGITAWVDAGIPYTPRILDGFGIEFEGRDINIGRPSALSRMRMDTLGGGPMYTLRRYRRIHPYAKYLIGIGSIDFPQFSSVHVAYTHDTRTIYAPGFGLEYRLGKGVLVRADYEYQFWPKLFGPHSLNPHGFTFGAMYDFARHR